MNAREKKFAVINEADVVRGVRCSRFLWCPISKRKKGSKKKA